MAFHFNPRSLPQRRRVCPRQGVCAGEGRRSVGPLRGGGRGAHGLGPRLQQEVDPALQPRRRQRGGRGRPLAGQGGGQGGASQVRSEPQSQLLSCTNCPLLQHQLHFL